MKLKPCRKCGSKDVDIWDCGYSSFNVGGIKCLSCGHEVKVSPCGLDPQDELITAWNKDKPTIEEQLKAAKKEIRRLKKLLNLTVPRN